SQRERVSQRPRSMIALTTAPRPAGARASSGSPCRARIAAKARGAAAVRKPITRQPPLATVNSSSRRSGVELTRTAEHRDDLLLRDGADDPALGDDAGDVAGGRDVEGRVPDLHLAGRGADALDGADLVGGALLDRDLLARGDREVERGARRGDVKRDAVLLCEDRHAVGADLV